MTIDRKLFTRHGFHLNKIGKEGLAKEIALQITEIIKAGLNNNKPLLPLPWNEEPKGKNAIVDISLTKNYNPPMGKSLTSSPLNCSSAMDNASISVPFDCNSNVINVSKLELESP
jgi:hypothetical protein